ncbi:hypothetical protein D3C78_834370 [compost metagenome]
MFDQCRGIAMDDPEVAPLQLAEIRPTGENGFYWAEDQSQRRAQFMADIGEKVALQLIQVPDLVEQLVQFFVLPRDLGFSVLLLGDVAAFGEQKHDLAVLVSYGQQREVDNDRFLASGLTVDFDFAAHELAPACPEHAVALVVLGLLRNGPPARLPERFALNVAKLDTRPIERGLVDLEGHAVRVKQAYELIHLIQHNARELLPVGLEIVSSGERHIADVKYR